MSLSAAPATIAPPRARRAPLAGTAAAARRNPHAAAMSAAATELTHTYETNILYSPCQATETLMVPIHLVGKRLHQTLEAMLAAENEGKCNQYGYIRPNSTRVLATSNPECRGAYCSVEVLYKCSVFHPVDGMNLKCVAVSISKAGIMAKSADETPSPFQLMVARDHYYSNDVFHSIEKGDTFVARVKGSRFELNDAHVMIIGEAKAKL